ncbi:MAG: hypothetical protein Q9195_002676 [Heterodermia aff. obscurata]
MELSLTHIPGLDSTTPQQSISIIVLLKVQQNTSMASSEQPAMTTQEQLKHDKEALSKLGAHLAQTINNYTTHLSQKRQIDADCEATSAELHKLLARREANNKELDALCAKANELSEGLSGIVERWVEKGKAGEGEGVYEILDGADEVVKDL